VGVCRVPVAERDGFVLRLVGFATDSYGWHDVRERLRACPGAFDNEQPALPQLRC
jgi:hypothetical protein